MAAGSRVERFGQTPRDIYQNAPIGLALPILTSRILTDILVSVGSQGEFQALITFDEWLQGQEPVGSRI